MREMKRSPIWQWLGMGIGLFSLLFTLVFGSAGWGFSLLCFGIMLIFEYIFAFRRYKVVNPYYLLSFSLLLLLKYSSIIDFRIRVLCFVLIY